MSANNTAGKYEMTDDAAFNEKLNGLQRKGLIVGGVAALLLVLGLLFSPVSHLFQGFFFGYIFWVSITIGCIPLAMIHYLFGGAWGASILRILETGMRTLPLMMLLFIPVLIGLPYTHIWANHDLLAQPEHAGVAHFVELKTAYLNVPFFIVRTLVYFAIWSALSYFLRKWSAQLDVTRDPGITLNLKRLSGAGMVFFVVSITFAAFDWLMSITPEWFSGIYGAIIGIGMTLEAFAFTVLLMVVFSRRAPYSNIMSRKLFGDYGNLLLALVMIWTYVNLSQLIIIWSANLPEETPWYLHRVEGAWRVFPFILGIFHFFVPFLLLLSAEVRRSASALFKIAILLLVMRFLDLYWLIVPGFERHGFPVYWQDVVGFACVGGLWLAFFIRQLKSTALVAEGNPSLSEVYEHA
ncbi:MAG: hypothetical protein RBU21_21485 [FCB group bacterium]|jgi:hypothetical protein|nr:hypothetical protein [FCB group bacterium]